MTKNSVLETLNGQMNEHIENLGKQIKALEAKNNLINERFKTLSDYNEEIIKFKDEYKSKSGRLEVELADLKKKMNSSELAMKFTALQSEIENKTNGILFLIFGAGN